MARTRTSLEDEIEANRVPPSVYDLARFNLPTSFIEKNPEWIFTWVAKRSNGIDCIDTYKDMWRHKWVAVTEEEYQEDYMANYISPFGDRDVSRNLVERGGQILMKRRREENEKELNIYRHKSNLGIKKVREAVDMASLTAEMYDSYRNMFAER